MALAVVLVLLAPVAAIGAEQTVDVTVLPADTLAIDVESDFGLGAVVPGQLSDPNGFEMGITNTTSGGWEVTVESTDLTSFYWDNCDENGCHDRIATDPLYTIGADNLLLTGGGMDHWDPAPLTSYSGYLAAAGTSFLLVEGTSAAYGMFGIDNPHTTIQVDVPPLAEIADYTATLTYTIMTPAP